MRKLLILLAAALCLVLGSGVALAGQLKVAALYTTPVEEPYIGNIHEALEKAVKDYGIEYQHTEKVTQADFERVLREYAEKGFELIFVDAYGNEETTRRVAKDYPEVSFMAASDLGPEAPNMGVFTAWIHEPTYLCGLMAGMMTKSNVVGIVAGLPIPVVNVPANAFVQGVIDANPKCKVLVSYIGSFFDPPKAREAAIAQIEAGADVLFADRYGVIEAAQSKGIPAFGNMVDQVSLGPDTVVSSPIWVVWPTVQKVVEDKKAGKFEPINYKEYSMMAKGGAHLAPYHKFENKLPQNIKDAVNKRSEEIKSGAFVVPVKTGQAKTHTPAK